MDVSIASLYMKPIVFIATSVATGFLATIPVFASLTFEPETLLTIGSLLGGAVWTIAKIKSSTTEEINNVKNTLIERILALDSRIDEKGDKFAERFTDLQSTVALLKQEHSLKGEEYNKNLSTAIDTIVQLKGHVTSLEMQVRDIQGWMQSRGANFYGRSGWDKSAD